MKKLFTLAALFCLALSVNAQEMPRHKKPKETKDPNVLDITKNQGTAITYETPAEVQAEFEKKANLNMWAPEQKTEEAKKLPAGGKLWLNIGRLAIGSADTKYFTVVVQDETGTEVFRQQLKSSVADPSTANGLTIWKNLGLVYLDTPLKTGYKVFVVDAIANQRHEYLIQN